MITLVSIIWLGFFLGMRHATDPDHVIAVSTIVSRERTIRHAAKIGVVWGFGHTLTLLIVGGGVFLLGLTIPRKLGLSMEFSVGLMLILLGALNLASLARWAHNKWPTSTKIPHASSINQRSISSEGPGLDSRGHAEPAHGDDDEHGSAERLDRRFGRWRVYRLFRPLLVGIVHGLAGSAAVALLVLPLIHRPLWAMVYLAIFGLGTIAGMLLVTAIIAVPFAYSANRSTTIHRHLGLVSGFVSLAFGAFVVYENGFVEGLFR